jgi:hypothetical protein
MNNTKNTGGPAFPVNEYVQHNGLTIGVQEGMNLRDYFAAKAMQSIYTATVDWTPTGTPMDEESLQVLADVAQDAYKLADAMIKAREET